MERWPRVIAHADMDAFYASIEQLDDPAPRRWPEPRMFPPRFERYREISRMVMEVFADFSPAVEALSLDEAFLDMTGSAHIFGAPHVFARKLKDAVADRTGGLTVSVGVSRSKDVGKAASSPRQ